MQDIHALLAEYGESHRNPVNKLFHWICVPLIVWSLLAMLWMIKISALPVNAAWVVIVLAMFYYLALSVPLALGSLLLLTLMAVGVYGLEQVGVPIVPLAVIIFVLAWIGQLIGHKVEGKNPSFFTNLLFLLIGPLWLLAFVYRRLGIKY